MRLIQLSLILIIVLIPTLTHAAEPTEPDVIVIFHDAFNTYQDIQPEGVTHAGMYHESTVPWVDLLVRLDDGLWYGPERNADDIEALPLPEGYAWACASGFGCLPSSVSRRGLAIPRPSESPSSPTRPRSTCALSPFGILAGWSLPFQVVCDSYEGTLRTYSVADHSSIISILCVLTYPARSSV